MYDAKLINTWRSRDLVHWQALDGDYFITYRVAGSLPVDEGFSKGVCDLSPDPVARIIIDSLNCFEGKRYCLHAWCVMSTHVHVVARIFGRNLASVVQGWKGFTARKINHLLGRRGSIWQRDYFDHYARDEHELIGFVNYVRNNQ